MLHYSGLRRDGPLSPLSLGYADDLYGDGGVEAVHDGDADVDFSTVWRSASLAILEPEITTAGDMGRMVITVLGMVADMELKFIRDRQRAGIQAAKARGIYKRRQEQVMTLPSGAWFLVSGGCAPRCR